MEYTIWLIFCILSGLACFWLFYKSIGWFSKI